MKLCKNCEYSCIDQMFIPRCHHVKSIHHTDLYSGVHMYRSCENMRNNSADCGVDATFYSERKSSSPALLIKRIFEAFNTQLK